MTTERAGTGGLSRGEERRAGESVAALAEHLARLLAQADKLLAEWKAHADGVKDKLDAGAKGAGEQVARALEGVLADVGFQSATQLQRVFGEHAEKLREDLERARRAATELEAQLRKLGAVRGGGGRGKTERLTLILALSANVLLAGLIAVVWLRGGQKVETMVKTTPPAVPVTSSAPPEGPPAQSRPTDSAAAVTAKDAGAAAVAPAAPLCGGLTVDHPVTSTKLAAECLIKLCSPKDPIKVGQSLTKVIAACHRDDAPGKELVAAFAALEQRRSLFRISCPPPEKDAAGSYTVTARWLEACAK